MKEVPNQLLIFV